jgi:hypothetical protein
MLLSAFTAFHVLLSLIGIISGLVVLYGMLTAKGLPDWTAWFLITTVATSATGFLFPFHGFKPSYIVGILSLVFLALAIAARYRYGLLGGWRKTYVISAVIALYFNVFVLIAQLFMKVPPLHALAPTGSEPPFLVAQIIVMLLFVMLGFRAVAKFRDTGGSLLETKRSAAGA